MHDGKVCVLDAGYLGRGIIPVTERRYGWSQFFVHPNTGVLEAIPKGSRSYWKAQKPESPATEFWISKNISRRQIRGLWFECRFIRPDSVKGGAAIYDHALERAVRRDDLSRHHNRYLLCVHKRQLSRRELRAYGLRNGVPVLGKAQSSVGRACDLLTTALRLSAGRRLWVIGTGSVAETIRPLLAE